MAEAENKVSEQHKRLELYNEVVERAVLDNVQLMSCSFDLKPAFFEEVEGNELSLEATYKGHLYEDDSEFALGFIDFVVTARGKRKKTMTCRAQYHVLYENLKGCDGEAVGAFLNRLAPFTSFPYFRSMFATLNWAAGLNLPPIPILKEPKKRQQKTIEANE